jgi:glycosyltransferase involved in cell wall biosynthesis
MNPLISVIIPTFNRAELLQQTIQSVKIQTYTNWECLIIDDGSVDNTKEIVKNLSSIDSRFIYYQRPEARKKGPSSCRNYGIKKSRGKLIIFLDSDDLLSTTCLSNRVVFAIQNPNFDFWIFEMELFNEVIGDLKSIFNSYPEKNEVESHYYRDRFLMGEIPFCVTSPLWNKESLLQLQGFDENMKMLEDPDLHLRAYLYGLKSLTSFAEADCYYRKATNNNRLLPQKKYEEIAAISNFYFLKKHFIVGNKFVKTNYKNNFNKHVFYDKSFQFQYKMIQFGFTKKIITYKHVILSYLILFYCILGIHKIKGSGYTILRTKFNNF